MYTALVAAVIGLAAGSADAAIVTLVDDGGNIDVTTDNIRHKVTVDSEFESLNPVEIQVTTETRDNLGVLGFNGIMKNDSNLSWLRFSLELIGAPTWDATTINRFVGIDDEGIMMAGASFDVELDATGKKLEIAFNPALTDESQLHFGNLLATFDAALDMKINIGGLAAGTQFNIVLKPSNSASNGGDNGNGNGQSIPLPAGWAMGLAGLGLIAGLRRGRRAA